MVSKRSRILLVKNILMKHLQCHKNNAPQLKKKKNTDKKASQPVNERNTKQMFSLFPNIFRSLKKNHEECFYYAPVMVNIWH